MINSVGCEARPFENKCSVSPRPVNKRLADSSSEAGWIQPAAGLSFNERTMNDQTPDQRDRHQFTGKEAAPTFTAWTCPGCGGNKAAKFVLCPSCYWRLPKELQGPLCNRVGRGQEDALAAAMDYLVEHYGAKA